MHEEYESLRLLAEIPRRAYIAGATLAVVGLGAATYTFRRAGIAFHNALSRESKVPERDKHRPLERASGQPLKEQRE